MKVFYIEAVDEKFWIIANDESQAKETLDEQEDVLESEIELIKELSEEEMKELEYRVIDYEKTEQEESDGDDNDHYESLFAFFSEYKESFAQIICSSLYTD